ncbi:putative quinol monooxygenase [Paraburkholderia sp. C35]|uniref:putative quinol monooxygenase n=1 Tax=Paraburkholderia sp. C35 TaxID=2126993 RepID=UPI0013A5494C|nr:putative quinol monooxygenase [Paraburkholderia sp. C35]
MIVVLATVRIKPETAAPFLSTALELVTATRSEPGCISYELLRGQTESTYSFLERYRDEDSAAAHRKTEHFRTLGKQLGDYLDGKPEVVVLQGLD